MTATGRPNSAPGGVAEQRLRRGIGRGDQPAAVRGHDAVLGGVDDAAELAGHADEILAAEAAGSRPPVSAVARRRCRMASAARAASRPSASMSTSPPGRPRGQATTRWPTTSVLDHHGKADLAGHGASAAAGGGRRPAASDSARARTRGTALPGSCGGDVGDVRPRQLEGRGGDPGEGRPDVAGRSRAPGSRPPAPRARGGRGRAASVSGWRRASSVPCSRVAQAASLHLAPTRVARASTPRTSAPATTP